MATGRQKVGWQQHVRCKRVEAVDAAARQALPRSSTASAARAHNLHPPPSQSLLTMLSSTSSHSTSFCPMRSTTYLLRGNTSVPAAARDRNRQEAEVAAAAGPCETATAARRQQTWQGAAERHGCAAALWPPPAAGLLYLTALLCYVTPACSAPCPSPAPPSPNIL